MDRARLNQAESIFNDLAGLAKDSRAANLEVRCGGDGELRSLVEHLLANDDSGMGDFLRMPVFFPADPGAPGPPKDASKGPQSIGGYEIVRCIGEGGMGVVYEARQANPRRTVALKVLRSALPSSAMLARFRHEAHVLAQLRHPGIAHIYEAAVAQVSLAGGIQAAQPYFAMELVEGQPLRVYVESRKLDIRRRLELMTLVCEAVQHAHEKGVIHRDLKSENILIEASGQPRILDFGVARLAGSDDETRDPGAPRHTRAGEIVGTLAYMSPEQVGGDSAQVDTRSDVYSLGVILYNLLNGRLPHDLSGLPLAEAARRIRDIDPLPPSAHNPRLRGDVDWMVMKCLEKDRSRRYHSAIALGEDIQRHLRDESVHAGRPTRMYRFRKLVRRNRGAFAAGTAIMATLVAAVIGTAWQAVRTAEQALRARETADLLKRMIRSATPEMALGETPTVREMLDAASRELEHDESVHPLVAADTHGVLVGAYDSLGEYSRAEVHARRAVELHAAHQGPRHPDALEAAGTLARALSRLDRDDEAMHICREALDAAQADLGPDQPASISLALNYAFVLTYTASPDQAEIIRWTREGYARCADAFGKEDPRTLRAATDLGVTLMDAGQLDEAEPLLRSVLETRQRDLGDDHPDVLLSLSNLVGIPAGREDLPGAIVLGQQVLERAERILGPDHPRTCRYATNLARFNGQLGRWAEAETYARRAMAGAARLGPAHPDVLEPRSLLAMALTELKRLDEAQPLVEEQNELCLKTLGATHPDTLVAITLRFDLAKAQGRLDQMRHWAEALRGTRWEESVFKQIEEVEAAERAKKQE